MSSPPSPEMQKSVRIIDLAVHLAEELSHLALLSQTVQEALSDCVFAEPPDEATLARLQSIDRIGQGLADLTRLMGLFQARLPGETMLPRDVVLAHLHLRELADRIVARNPSDRPDILIARGEVVWL